MDLLDELSISDVRTTAQDTLIKECGDGNISDINDYPVRIDVEVFKKDDDYSHIKEHIYDVLESFSQYIEYSNIFVKPEDEIVKKTKLFTFGLRPHFYSAHSICNFLDGLNENLRILGAECSVSIIGDVPNCEETVYKDVNTEKIRRESRYSSITSQFSEWNTHSELSKFNNVCRMFVVPEKYCKEYVHMKDTYETLIQRMNKFLMKKVDIHHWQNYDLQYNEKIHEQVNAIHERINLSERILLNNIDFGNFISNDTQIWMSTYCCGDFKKYKIGPNVKDRVPRTIQRILKKLKTKRVRPCPKISWRLMKTGSMSPIYIRSVIYLGEFSRPDDAFCIGTALAVVCPLEKYENLMTSIFIPRKRELKTSPRSETNSLFLGNIFK